MTPQEIREKMLEVVLGNGGHQAYAWKMLTDRGESIGADLRFGWPDRFIPHGKVDELERRFGLDPDSIAEAING